MKTELLYELYEITDVFLYLCNTRRLDTYRKAPCDFKFRPCAFANYFAIQGGYAQC